MWRKTFDFFSCALVQPVEFFPAASLGDLFVEGKTRHDRSGTVGKKSPPISDISTGPDSKNLALVLTVCPLPRKRFCLLTTCFSAPTRLEAASPRGTLARGSDMIEHASWTGDYPVFFPSPSKKTGWGTAPKNHIPSARSTPRVSRLSKENAGCFHARPGAHFRVRRRPRQVRCVLRRAFPIFCSVFLSLVQSPALRTVGVTSLHPDATALSRDS